MPLPALDIWEANCRPSITSLAKCETKTKDNVFVNVVASVQYRSLPEKTSDAFYKLSNQKSQIQAYVFDVIRASFPKLNLDDAFEQKNDIARAVEEELEKAMSAYGYEKAEAEKIIQIKRAEGEAPSNCGWTKRQCSWLLSECARNHC